MAWHWHARHLDERTLGERVADRVAAFGGSWKFIGLFFVFMAAWITINSFALWWQPFDSYPYILLNLLLSLLAAIQAPVIMMSQNRQEARDRLHAQHDYEVNLEAKEIILMVQEGVKTLRHEHQSISTDNASRLDQIIRLLSK
jgi:uncharacterized membrane protein